MTYLQFHLIFILPPLLALAALRPVPLGHSRRFAWGGLALLATLAFAYTTPWDNYLVANAIWYYGPDRVIGTLGHVPLEEYAFFLLQPFLTGLWTYFILRRRTLPTACQTRPITRWAHPMVWLALAVAAAFALPHDPFRYGALILVWAGPMLAIQGFFGGRLLAQSPRELALCILPPTFYLWVADQIAITNGIWTIATETSTAILVLGLPVEEALFFLVTNILIVQALFLWLEIPRQYPHLAHLATPPSPGS